jgi:hypothetical protein
MKIKIHFGLKKVQSSKYKNIYLIINTWFFFQRRLNVSGRQDIDDYSDPTETR